MRIKITAFLMLLFFAGTAICRSGIFVEYKNGDTETVKKAKFKETVFFRTKGRRVEVNPKKIQKMDIFADTIEIYYSDTWIRADVYPVTKDSIPPVYRGFIKVNTILTGISDFGNLSIAISELKHINFRPAKEKKEEAETETVASDTANIVSDTLSITEETAENPDSIAVEN